MASKTDSSANGEAAPSAEPDEVDDYMSETLLQSIRQAETENRPRTLGRKRKQVENPVSVKKLMQENLERGFESRIPQSNIGYKLMAKMGYQEGTGLGKHGQGIVEPLRVEPKQEKTSGVGVEEPQRKKQQEIKNYIRESKQYRAHTMAAAEAAFPDSIKDKLKQRSALVHLARARRTIMELDTRSSREAHDLWPESSQEITAEETVTHQSIIARSTEELVTAEGTIPDEDHVFKLERCIYYLRDEYNYCMFCGCQYSDLEDMITSCPGPTEEHHE